VALGHMMSDLPHRPSAIAVRGFDLLWSQTLHGGAQRRGSLRDVVDQSSETTAASDVTLRGLWRAEGPPRATPCSGRGR